MTHKTGQKTEAELRLLVSALRDHRITDGGDLCEAFDDLSDVRFPAGDMVIEEYLRDKEGEVRAAAIIALTVDYKCRRHLATCEYMIRTETDADALRSAVTGLGSLVAAYHDTAGLKTLAEVFRSPDLDLWTRESAYSGILFANGIREHPHLSKDEQDLLSKVDWSLVEQAEAGKAGVKH